MSETVITVVMEFKYIMGTVFTKFRLIFHKISLIMNRVFPPLSETVGASHGGVLHAHGDSPSLLLQNDFLRVHPSVGQNKEIRRVLIRDFKED